MVRSSALLLVLFAAACGGGSAPPATGVPAPAAAGAPAATAAAAVEQFMAAVADSNLTRMGQLWGTARGAAAVTGQPARWREHIIVMQAYLKGGDFRVISNVETAGSDGRREVTVELVRGGCSKQIPFTAVRWNAGSWLISNVDISQAGNPVRPCGEF